MPVLEPIEESPFKLEPVEGNPFSDSLQGNFGSASQQLLAQEAQRRGVVGNVLQHFTLPGRIAQGVQPQTPGVMTEEDAYRLNQQNNEALDWAHGQALNTIGTGMPMAEKMALGAGGGAIKAYHGSPYDFEKFDIGKIGTGEGAQSYGHGLYFAENPATAKNYRDALSVADQTPAQSIAEEYFRRANNDSLVAQKLLGEHVDMFGAKGQEAMEILKSGKGLHPGRIYEVNINADPEHFLDWDKPLSEQHRETAAQLVPHRAAYYRDPNSSPSGASLVDDLTGGKFANQAAASEKLREVGIPGIKYLDQGSRNVGTVSFESKYRAAQLDNSRDMSERFFATRFKENNGDLNATVRQLQSDLATHPNDATVKKTLDFAQNPEHKFTFHDEPITHNYVVFHHDIVDILKKYGLAGLVGAGAAHFKTTPVEGNPYTQ